MSDSMAVKPGGLLKVSTVDGYKDLQSKHVAALTASKTIAELLTVAIDEDAAGVTIITEGGVVNYNPVGEADATHALLPAVYTALGGASIIGQLELFAAASTTVELIVFGVNG